MPEQRRRENPPVERTTMQLSMTVEDKKALKTLAAQRGKTVASVVHEWIVFETERGEQR